MGNFQKLEVILTAQCNLSCAYCYQNAKSARHMEWPTLQAALDRLLESPHRELEVLFIGGEPLMQLPLMRRGVDYVERRRAKRQSIRFATVTNGMLIDREAAGFFDVAGFAVQLSFDGVAAAQDLRGKGTHVVLNRLLDRLRLENPSLFHDRLTVATTMTVATIPHLADSIDYLLHKGVNDIGIEPAVLPEEVFSREHHEELDRQFARIFEGSVRHFELTGLVPIQRFRGASSNPGSGSRSLCGVSRGDQLTVDVDGEVSGCVTFADSYQRLPKFLEERIAPTRMGHVSASDFRERYAGYSARARAAELFDNQQDDYSSYGRCSDCRHLASCGVCPMTIGYQTGNEDPNRIPDFVCAFNLISLDYRARFPRMPSPAEILTGEASIPAWMKALERASQGSPRLEQPE